MRRTANVLLLVAVALLSWQAGASMRPNAAGSGRGERGAEPAGSAADGGGATASVSQTAAALVLPGFDLPYLITADGMLEERMRFPQSGGGAPHLFVLFTLADCYKGYADVRYWSELRDAFGEEVVVVGIVAGEHPRKVEYFLRRQGVGIPVLHDETGAFIRAVTASAAVLTPALVLSTAEGRVLRIEQAANGDSARQAAVRRALASSLPTAAAVEPVSRPVSPQVQQ